MNMKKGGGFGVVILLVVVAIVLLLVARAWTGLAPAAQQVAHDQPGTPLPAHGQTDAAEAIRAGKLPNLDGMRRSTTEHSDRVQDALEAIE